MISVTHRGIGKLETPLGGVDVSYVLTVTRTTSVEDGYGHLQAKGVNFPQLVQAGKPLQLVL